MTELTVACVGFQTEDDKIGSCGTIAPGVELKVGYSYKHVYFIVFTVLDYV